MVRILEDESKRLLRERGIPTPNGVTIQSGEDVDPKLSYLRFPSVIKALVPLGGRKKLGAVVSVSSQNEANTVINKMLGSSLLGFPVEKVLAEEMVDISKELFVSIFNDESKRSRKILLGSIGGIDVEEISKNRPETLTHFLVDPLRGFELFQSRELSKRVTTGSTMVELAKVIYDLHRLFDELDGILLEINPLAITKGGRIVAVSSVMVLDDDSLYRHQGIQPENLASDRTWRPPTDREKMVLEADAREPYRGTVRYTELEGGNIALVCGGGGGSLVAFDAVKYYGGSPANYSEWGGNPTQDKVETLVRAALSKPGVVGLLICLNISNNTRTDIAATGIVNALKSAQIEPSSKFPVVIRLAGVNDVEANRIIQMSGFQNFGEEITMEDAASLIVKRVRELQ